ncbi:MAG TPA: arylamine N-acetyltransferase [Burkholderiales bacterium]|nr:arylamine N-acetyltransferase [Burkholderiales bacterium]
MEQPVDLKGYFERIGFRGAPSPTLETLQQLHLLHAQAIPFEGISPFIGEEVRLDIASVQEKLIRRGRGGYCFEQNVLFWRVLRTIGFSVIGLGGRVRLNWADDFITPRGHMLLLVTLPEGRYIADVGFGGLTLTAAVRLEPGVEQRTPHEPARIVEAGGLHNVQVKLGTEWKTLYTFELGENFMPDYEIWNWYYAANPQSPFVNGVILARPEPGRRHALRNARYTVHHVNGASETRQISSVGEFRGLVNTAFKLPLPTSRAFDEKLERVLCS